MREILFRGQTRRYGEKVRMGDGQKLPSRWVYGGVLQGSGDHSIIYGGENENDPSVGLDKWVVYTDTLGQFTGLTDKNGKKIFEGDVIGYKGATGYVNFEFGCFCVREMGKSENNPAIDIVMICNAVEVIGNIHDNPELLEVD